MTKLAGSASASVVALSAQCTQVGKTQCTGVGQ